MLGVWLAQQTSADAFGRVHKQTVQRERERERDSVYGGPLGRPEDVISGLLSSPH